MADTLSNHSCNNISLACRICLNNKTVKSVSLLDIVWLEKFEYCMNIKVNSEDCASKVLCGKCADMLVNYDEFKKCCFKSDTFWKNFIANGSELGIDPPNDNVSQFVKKESHLNEPFGADLVNSELIYGMTCTTSVDTVVKEEQPLLDENFHDKTGSDYDLLLNKQQTNLKTNMHHKKVKNNMDKVKKRKMQSVSGSKRKLKKFGGQCDHCEKEFFYRGSLESHLKHCFNDDFKIRCRKVVKRFRQTLQLPKNDVFYCGLCDMSTPNNKTMSDHLKEHESNIELNCKFCDYSGADFADILAHRFEHQPKEFKLIVNCHLCDKVYRKVNKLEFHYRGEHLKRKPGLCNICGNTFTSYKNWRKHVIAHAGTQYRCDKCGRYFVYKSDLANHMLYHTNNEKSFICHLCGFSCRLASGLRSHVARQHRENKPVKCEHCGKTFKSEITLREHKLKSEGEKNYVCHICSKKFKTEKFLEAHMFWHSGLKPYVCSTCGNAYKSKCSLKGHIRSHTGERPFQCDVCSSCFRSSNVLNKHKRLHTGEKAYKCTSCDKGFNVKKLLLIHNECHGKSVGVGGV